MSVRAFRKREPPFQHLRLHAQQPRLLRAIQIQATRLVAVAHAERNEAHACEIAFVQRKEIPAGLRVQILHHRHRRFADEREAARAGSALASRPDLHPAGTRQWRRSENSRTPASPRWPDSASAAAHNRARRASSA